EEGRRREPHAPRELHVVPGERDVDCRGNKNVEPLVGGGVGDPGAERPGDHAVGVERHVVAVLLGRPDREQDGVDALLDRRLHLRPRHPLDEALAHRGDLPRMSDIVQYSAAMEGRAQVNGVELWYQVSGEGEPVVQIHGAGFGHFNFAPATPELARHFKVVDYDMRGYGQSDRPVQDYDM